jgi:hypothetical protein
MAEKYAVIITGNGNTTRANVEALLDDHYYAKGKNGTIVLPFYGRPSQGQVWSAQLAKFRGLDIVIFSQQNAFLDNISSASLIETDTPIDDAISQFSSKELDLFILWDDEDEVSARALAISKKLKISAFDLCDGLVVITPNASLEPQNVPDMPDIEVDVSEAFEEPSEAEEEDLEEVDSEESEDEEETFEEVFWGLQALIKALAKAVVEEMKAQGLK